MLHGWQFDATALVSFTFLRGSDTTHENHCIVSLHFLLQVVEFSQTTLVEVDVEARIGAFRSRLEENLDVVGLTLHNVLADDVWTTTTEHAALLEFLTLCLGKLHTWSEGERERFRIEFSDGFSIYLHEVSGSAHGKTELTCEVAGELTRVASREVVGWHTLTKSITTIGHEVDASEVFLANRIARPIGGSEVLTVETFLAIATNELHLWNLNVFVLYLATSHVIHLCLWHLVLDALQDGDAVGWCTAIVTTHHFGIVGIRTNHDDALQVLGERQHVVLVLQQHLCFTSEEQGMVAVCLTIDNASRNLGIRIHLVGVEHTEFDASLDESAQRHVDFLLTDCALFHAFDERLIALSALQVGTVSHGIGTGEHGVGMGAVVALDIEVVDGIAVAHHQSLVFPTVAQNLNEQTARRATRLTLVSTVGTHHLLHVALSDESLEGWQIGFPKVASRWFCIELVAKWFWSTMNGKVLGTCMRLVILRVVALHTEHHSQSHAGTEVRVLAVGFLSTSPTRVAEDVHVWSPEREVW